MLSSSNRDAPVQLSDQLLALLTIVSLIGVVVLGSALTVVALRLRRLRTGYDAVLDPARREDLFEVLERRFGEVEQLREAIAVVHRNTEHLRSLLRAAVSRVGVVRYDAFDDMGGALSFSAAILDESGDGVVLSSINGRTEARTYAKPVTGGTSSYNLSPEEEAAIDAALTGERQAVVNPPRRRRGRAAS
ncbi:MAG: DUF4446 family protein [Actinobacteria bacterium]|nr:DUF4446 family protein [Actinomycetota bacterium]